jgi:ferredoxin
MRITVNEDTCIGAGQCVLAAPEVFDQRDDGIAVILTDTPAETQHIAIRDAAIRCPALALHLDE